MRTKADKPKISVIIPVYNHYEYLEECIESVLKQTYDNYEIVIIDDNSSDERVKKYLKSISEKHSSITLILSNRNQGISVSQNLAVDAAKGAFIAFLDCDDYLSPQALDKATDYLFENPDVKYVFTDRAFIDASDTRIGVTHYTDNPEIDNSSNHKDNLLVEMVATHLKIVSKKALLEVGGCDPNLTGVQDYDIALKISEKHALGYIAEPLYFHRIHRASVTSSGSRIPQHVKSGYALKTALKRRRLIAENESVILARPDFIENAQTRQLIDWQIRGYDVTVAITSYKDLDTIIPKIGLISTLTYPPYDTTLYSRITKDLSLLVDSELLKLTTQ